MLLLSMLPHFFFSFCNIRHKNLLLRFFTFLARAHAFAKHATSFLFFLCNICHKNLPLRFFTFVTILYYTVYFIFHQIKSVGCKIVLLFDFHNIAKQFNCFFNNWRCFNFFCCSKIKCYIFVSLFFRFFF